MGRTRDVLLAQMREVNQVMRELQKYSHHVTLFTQICHRLVSIYSKDQTEGIQQLAGSCQAGTTASAAAALPGQRACRRRWSLSTCSTGRWLSSWPGLGKWRQAWKGWMAKLRDLQGEMRDRDKQFCSGLFLRRNFTHSLMSCLPHATPPKCVTTLPRSLLNLKTTTKVSFYL